MKNKTMLVLSVLLLFTVLSAAPAQDDSLPVPQELVRDDHLHHARADAEILAARRFYAFWSSGDARFLDAALSPEFVDRTLPPGRPQGPSGPRFASTQFRAAVPDLRCDIVQLILSRDRIVAHLRFRGHFLGTFGGSQGAGQSVDFIATDILRLRDGRITDNWHIEDNLTFLRQIGAVQQ